MLIFSLLKKRRELKQRRFWATHVKRKWGLLTIYRPWRWQICIAKFLFTYKDDLPESSTKPLSNDGKSPLPVDVRRSKTLLLKLPMAPLIHSSLKYSYPAHLLKLTKSSGRRFLFPVPLYFSLGLPAQLRCFLHSNPTKPPPIQASGDQRMDRNPFFNLRRGSHRIKGLRTRLKSNYHIARLSRVITVNYLIFTFSNCSWWFVQVSNSFFSSSSYALVCFLWMNLFSRKYSSGASLYKTAVIIKQKVKSHRKNQVILITWIK